MYRNASTACRAGISLARALAKLGEKRAAAHTVVASEQAYENVQLDNGAEWARFIDPAYLGSTGLSVTDAMLERVVG
ncbi:hypothetical protein ABZX88_30005 [Kitasatospora aureofaciens]|uniref:hypothetical protein n=1 Tax=Kitasatospora aureofaciens TaxID=1894 RepID=UPI0033BC97ED